MKGAYRFNDTITFEQIGSEGAFTNKLPFLSNNIRFNSIIISLDNQTIKYNNVEVYNKGWIEESYKVITFFGEQSNDEYSPSKEKFIEWFNASSSKIVLENTKKVTLKNLKDDGTTGDFTIYPKTLVTSILNADGTQWIPPESGSGSIGGGSGGGTMPGGNVTIGTSSSKSQVFSFGNQILLNFSWSSPADGDGILNIRINGESKKYETIQKGQQSIDMTSYLTSATDYIVDFIVEDLLGSRGSIRFFVKLISLSIVSSFNKYEVKKGTVPFRYIAYGDVEKNVVIKIDNEVITLPNVSTGIANVYNIENLTHGVHTLEAYVESSVGTSYIKSNVIKYKFAYAEEGVASPVIIIFNEDNLTYSDGQVVNIDYLVYNSKTLETPVYVELNERLVYNEPLVVDSSLQTVNIVDYSNNENRLKIYYNEESYAEYSFNIEESSIDVEAAGENEGLVLALKSNGKTNDNSERDKWEYNGITTTFNNFNFKTDGWKQDDKGITALKMTGGSNIEINYKPFENDFRATGRVIEFEFMTSNVTNYDASIIDIIGENPYGIMIKPTELNFKSNSVSFNSKFKENEHMRISILFEHYTEQEEQGEKLSHRFIKTYINGVLSGIKVYSESETFKQEKPTTIKVGDINAGCDVYLYKIRVYNNELSDINILNNYIADNDNYDEKLRLFTRSKIYDSNFNVNYDKVKNLMPVLIITAPNLPPDKKTYLNATWEVIHPTDSTQNWKKEVEFAVQGTSSTQYVVKNYQMRLKDQSEENRIALFDGAIKEKALTLKADYASSAGVYNIGNAKIVDKLYRDLGYLNPRQTAENTVRNSLWGYPVAVFYRKSENDQLKFFCKGSLNLSKEALALGYSGKDESWSTEDNISPLCLFDIEKLGSNLTEEQKWASIGKSFDARYNGNDSTDEYSNLKVLIQWVSDCKGNVEKFSKECSSHFDVDYLKLYYVMGMVMGGADSFAKNMYLAYFEQNQKWYPQFYDIDTTWGINNTGELSFGYNSEFKDKAQELDDKTGQLKDSYIFNGADSVLWTLVEQAFDNKVSFKDPTPIEALYKNLRANNYLNFDTITDILIKQGIDQYPEAIYNEDANLKYIDPYIDGRDKTRLGVLLGSTEENLKYWIKNRLYYLDSKWNASDYTNDLIALRTATASSGSKITFNLTSYRDMYMQVQFATNYFAKQRANKNTEYSLDVRYPNGVNPNDTEISIFGASSYTKIGDLSSLYLRKLDVSKATSLTELIVGSSAYGYSNPNLNEFTIGANRLLKKIDITNCSALSSNIDAGQCDNLEEFLASGTRITGVTFPSGGRLKKVFIPNTVENLYISNQNNPELISNFITNGTFAKIKIENCNIHSLSYVRNSINAKKLTHLRLTGINWQLEDSSLIEYIYNNLAGINERNEDIEHAVLAGTIHINKITQRLYNNYKTRWGDDLTITYGEGDNPQFVNDYEVTFVNYDGKQIGDPIWVQENLYAEYTGPTPERSPSDSESYTFAGWLSTNTETSTSLSNTPITQNTTFMAQYVVTKIFTVTWRNWNGNLLTTTKVSDGKRAYYPDANPTRLGDDVYAFYTFNGWDKDTALIKSDMEFTAVYLPGDLAEHIIEWYANDMMLEQDPKVKYGTVLSYDSEMPTSTNQSFYGWSTDPSSTIGKKENEFKAEGPFYDGKMKLYAVFGEQNRIEIVVNFGDTVPSGNIGVAFSINEKILEEDEYVTVEWGDGTSESTDEINDYSYPINTSYSNIRTFYKQMNHTTSKYEANRDYIIKIVKYGLGFKFAYFDQYSCLVLQSLRKYVKQINIYTDLDDRQRPYGIAYGCSELQKVEIGSKVTNLTHDQTSNTDSNPFTSSNKLVDISVAETNPVYDSRNNCKAVIEKETNTLVIGTGGINTIPDSVESIGNYAFYNCLALTSINIPSSVETIGVDAFYNCQELSSVTLHPNIEIIPDYCFYNCKKLTSITLPSELKEIGRYAFYQSGLTSINLSTTKIETIGSSVFGGCGSLTSITIPNSVTSMGSSVFSGCGLLERATIGNGLKILGSSSFYQCRKLTSVTLGTGLETLEGSAFYECTGLPVIVFPSSLKTIGSHAFYRCYSLVLHSGSFSGSVTTIGNGAFSECSKIDSVILSSSVTSIGNEAFSNCHRMATINLGNTKVSSIGYRAFYNCASLKAINLPNTLTTIGNYAFEECRTLTSVEIPKSVSSIGEAPFARCTSLTSINVNSENSNFSSDSDGVLYNKSQTTLIQFPAGLEKNIYDISSVVTNIGAHSFESCKKIARINSPSSVATIGSYAFSKSTVTRFEVSSGTSTIGDSAFSECDQLNNLVINEGVRTIGSSAFYKCVALRNVSIPNSVTSIGDYAFKECNHLVSLTFGNGITKIPYQLCFECSVLNNLVIPDSVESIGNYAFYKCYSLKTILIGSGVKSIGSQAFYTDQNVEDKVIRMKPAVAPTITIDTFNPSYFNKSSRSKIIVEYSSSNTIFNGYLEATNWVSYKEIISCILAYMVNEKDYGGIVKTENESGETILTANPNQGYTFENWYHYTPGELIIENGVELEDYDENDFKRPFEGPNENGYYESTNQAAANSASKVRFYFDVEKDNQGLLIKYINSGEANYDFGIVGKVDAILSDNTATNSITDYVNFKGESSTEERQLVMAGLTKGRHFIELKYVKDGGGEFGNDSLQVKVLLGDLKAKINYGDEYSTEPEINVGVIDITDTTKEPLSLIAKFKEEV